MNSSPHLVPSCHVPSPISIMLAPVLPSILHYKLILYILIDEGTKRFNELMSTITQISQKTLTNQLRELEADGLITRQCFAEVPPRVEYSVTDKGKSLFPILELMCSWGEKNIDDRFVLTSPQCS